MVMCGGLTRIVGQSIRYHYKLLIHYSFSQCWGQPPGTVRRFAVPDRTLPDPTLLRQLLDRQEITAVMAAYACWADLNQPERQAAGVVADRPGSYPPRAL